MPRQLDTYEQVLEYLYSRINYERVSPGGYSARDFKLDRMRRLLAYLGDPHERIPAVHIAGTKGKGSTAVMIAGMLTAAGHRTGLFTSPHLSAFEERMNVGGVLPRRQQLVELVGALAEPVACMDRMPGRMSPTFFEITTALAWLYFTQQRAQLVVLEVGLGGRLDATNVCRPGVTVITNISRDHTLLLGSTLARIAAEKAGVIRREIPVVSGVTDEEPARVVADVCRRNAAPLQRLGREITYRVLPQEPGEPTANQNASDDVVYPTRIDVQSRERAWIRVPVPLLGEHQAANAALAVAAAGILHERGWPVSDAAVHAGMARVRWPVRVEVVSRRPLVVVDAAHNWASMAALLRTLDQHFAANRRILIFAATKDKDVNGMLRQALPRFDTIVLTQYQNNPRAVPVAELGRMVASVSEIPFHMAADPAAAWKLARRLSQTEDLICITGSFFIAAELRELVLDELRQESPHVSPPVASWSIESAD